MNKKLPGDINGDGKVSGADVVHLASYIAGLPEFPAPAQCNQNLDDLANYIVGLTDSPVSSSMANLVITSGSFDPTTRVLNVNIKNNGTIQTTGYPEKNSEDYHSIFSITDTKPPDGIQWVDGTISNKNNYSFQFNNKIMYLERRIHIYSYFLSSGQTSDYFIRHAVLNPGNSIPLTYYCWNFPVGQYVFVADAPFPNNPGGDTIETIDTSQMCLGDNVYFFEVPDFIKYNWHTLSLNGNTYIPEVIQDKKPSPVWVNDDWLVNKSLAQGESVTFTMLLSSYPVEKQYSFVANIDTAELELNNNNNNLIITIPGNNSCSEFSNCLVDPMDYDPAPSNGIACSWTDGGNSTDNKYATKFYLTNSASCIGTKLSISQPERTQDNRSSNTTLGQGRVVLNKSSRISEICDITAIIRIWEVQADDPNDDILGNNTILIQQTDPLYVGYSEIFSITLDNPLTPNVNGYWFEIDITEAETAYISPYNITTSKTNIAGGSVLYLFASTCEIDTYVSMADNGTPGYYMTVWADTPQSEPEAEPEAERQSHRQRQ